jgi:two-component system, NarL family, nitrate/nitrite response regulator NarL
MATTVLLADDDPVARAVLSRHLQGADGLELVAVAQDGDGALAALREHRPDVAVLDQLMPGLDGVEVARRARDEGLPTVVLLLSASLEGLALPEVQDAGVCGWLEKSAVSARSLADAVTAALARAGR